MPSKRRRNSLLEVESLESLTLLSGTSSIHIPPSLLHPNEVLNRKSSGTDGLPMSGSASAMTTVAKLCTEYQITNHRQNKAMVIGSDSPARALANGQRSRRFPFPVPLTPRPAGPFRKPSTT